MTNTWLIFSAFRGTQIFPFSLLICPLQQIKMPIPVVALSQTWICHRSLTGITSTNPAGGMDVCLLWVLRVLSGIGLCVEPITRPERSYRVWCVWVWSRNLEKSGGCRAMKNKKKIKLKWPVIVSLFFYKPRNLFLILRGKNNKRLRVLGKIFGPKGREHQSGKDFLPGGAHCLT